MIGAAFTLIILNGFPEDQSTTDSGPLQISTGNIALQSTSAPVVGALAPEFQLQDIHGTTISLTDFEGRVILLNFWATWCGPCRLEMPLLEQHYQAYADDNLIILAINLGESLDEVGAFVDELGLTFPVLLDPGGHVSELYRIIGYPSTVLINTTGRVSTIHVGILSEAQLRDYLLLAGISL